MDSTERALARDRVTGDRASARPVSPLDEWRFAPRTALALSGGGAKGAFAVGVVADLFERFGEKGWFAIVGGSSTGAIIAPLAALLGADRWMADEALDTMIECYSTLDTSDLLDRRRWVELLRRRDSLNGSAPLRELIYDRLRPEWFEWLRGPDAPDTYVVYTNFRTGSKHTASPRDEGMSRERFLDAVLASASVPGLMTATVVDGEPCYDGCLRDLVPVDRAIELGATTLLPVMLDPETIRDHEPRFDRLDRIMVRAFSILVDEVGWSDLEIARDRVRGVLIRNELLRIDDELAAARQSGAIRRARRAIQDLVSRRELEPLLGGRARLRRIIEGVRPDYELSSTPLDFHPAQMRSWMDHGRDVARRVIATTPFA